MGEFDVVFDNSRYNENTGKMSAFCVPRFRRDGSKTTGLRATDDGLSKTYPDY
jgi:hypothetical protein